MTFKPRPYQEELSSKGAEILNKLKIVYYACEVRIGKTFISLITAQKINAENVLFVTKKKAISSIQDDYNTLNPEFKITIINFESMHKLEHHNFDLVVVDEAHSISAYPKPSKRTKQLKQIVGKTKLIMMSGTPTPESYSQYYHQYYISSFSPFAEYSNFYRWSKVFVDVKERHLGHGVVKDYSGGLKSLISPKIEPYIITFTQKEAGFTTNVKEKVLYCDMKPITYKLTKQLQKDLVIEGKDEVILADTAVKLQSKLHQLFSGTIKFESGNRQVIDFSKAQFIYDQFINHKIGIFYKFKAEYDALKQIYGDDLTNDLEVFNNSDKNIALQVVSGREGISLKLAKYLVYYNIDFSAVSYWQSRDRLTTMNRKDNEVFWIFSKGGIESKIYQSVMNKKDYTLSVFKKDYGK